MSLLAINTVDRLDRPSAYYVGKVREKMQSVSGGPTRRCANRDPCAEQAAQQIQ